MAVLGETSSGIHLGLLAIPQEEISRRERPTTLLMTVPARQFRLRTKGRRAMPVPSKATIPPKLHIGQSQPFNNFTLCNRSGQKSVARRHKTQWHARGFATTDCGRFSAVSALSQVLSGLRPAPCSRRVRFRVADSRFLAARVWQQKQPAIAGAKHNGVCLTILARPQQSGDRLPQRNGADQFVAVIDGEHSARTCGSNHPTSRCRGDEMRWLAYEACPTTCPRPPVEGVNVARRRGAVDHRIPSAVDAHNYSSRPIQPPYPFHVGRCPRLP